MVLTASEIQDYCNIHNDIKLELDLNKMGFYNSKPYGFRNISDNSIVYKLICVKLDYLKHLLSKCNIEFRYIIEQPYIIKLMFEYNNIGYTSSFRFCNSITTNTTIEVCNKISMTLNDYSNLIQERQDLNNYKPKKVKN